MGKTTDRLVLAMEEAVQGDGVAARASVSRLRRYSA
jgi:hypothetical protein